MNILKLTLTSVVFLIALGSSSFADLKYNAFSGQWENVGSNYEMKYDSMNNNWGYQKPGAQLEYNSFSGKWEYER